MTVQAGVMSKVHAEVFSLQLQYTVLRWECWEQC